MVTMCIFQKSLTFVNFEKKNKAFTLIETLVALVIGMIAVGAMYFAYQYFNNTYQSITDRAAMSEAGRNSLSLIAFISS